MGCLGWVTLTSRLQEPVSTHQRWLCPVFKKLLQEREPRSAPGIASHARDRSVYFYSARMRAMGGTAGWNAISPPCSLRRYAVRASAGEDAFIPSIINPQPHFTF